MASYDFLAPRLFVETPLAAGEDVDLGPAALNYLVKVLRLGDGREVLAFNGRDGEWLTRIKVAGRRSGSLTAIEQVRPQPAAPDLLYLFAPLKHARLDYMVQKAVEMGAGALKPVFTARTVPDRVNGERMRANAIEAAEQCGILAIPTVHPAEDLQPAVRALGAGRLLVFCDEDAPSADSRALLAGTGGGPCAVLVGPEGGFTPEERTFLRTQPNVAPISLGPRILRADTAAVAALAIVQATLGDWR